MDLAKNVDVVVVGAGPGGATSALALSHLASRCGYGCKSVLVLDKHSSERTRSNTILLDAAPAHALEEMGCDLSEFAPATDWTQICPEEAVYNQYPLPSYHKGAGRRRITFSALFMLRRRPVFNVSINVLEQAIYQALRKARDVTLLHETELIEISEPEQGSTRVRFLCEGQSHEVNARYVIAADGTNSKTLELIGAAEKKGVRELETLISANFKQAGRGNTKYHNNNRTEEALALATGHGTSVFVKVPESPEWRGLSWSQKADREKLVALLHEGAARLGVSGDINFGLSLIDIRLERAGRSIYRNTIFVTGDARHSTTPRVALGANVAIMDATRAAQAITRLYSPSFSKRSLARPNYRIHTWAGAHFLGFLGGIVGSSQKIKSKSKTEQATFFSRHYKFWKTQLLMSFHWRAAPGSTWTYRSEDALGSLQDSRDMEGRRAAL